MPAVGTIWPEVPDRCLGTLAGPMIDPPLCRRSPFGRLGTTPTGSRRRWLLPSPPPRSPGPTPSWPPVRGLRNHARSPVRGRRGLSIGSGQWVALVRALFRGAPFVILDEPPPPWTAGRARAIRADPTDGSRPHHAAGVASVLQCALGRPHLRPEGADWSNRAAMTSCWPAAGVRRAVHAPGRGVPVRSAKVVAAGLGRMPERADASSGALPARQPACGRRLPRMAGSASTRRRARRSTARRSSSSNQWSTEGRGGGPFDGQERLHGERPA